MIESHIEEYLCEVRVMKEMDVALICKALSDANRLEIVQMLSEGEKCGCRILEKFDITQPTLSHHMKILVECGLVNDRKEGKWHHYSLNGNTLAEFKAFIEEHSTVATVDEKSDMTHKEKALSFFGRKFHCSQAVVAAYAQECGISEQQVLKLGSCFGSGMRKGEVCGACTGALMVLGLMYGQDDETDTMSRQLTNELNDKMMNRFAEVSGSYLCNELLKCDVSTREGIEYARDKELFTEFCPKMVANAVDILEQIISEQEDKK